MRSFFGFSVIAIFAVYGCAGCDNSQPIVDAKQPPVAQPAPVPILVPAPPAETVAPPEATAAPSATTAAPSETTAAPSETSAAPVDAATASVAKEIEPLAPWTYERYTELVDKSGRKMAISKESFDAIQARKEKALARIEKYLAAHFGSADPEVLRAFREIPREYFHYNYEGKTGITGSAYESEPKPWGIGYGSALSDYLGQAYMTQLAAPKKGDVVLEIGTGSGFQSSLLSRIVSEAYSIEIIEPLGKGVAKALQAIGYDRVHTKVGDGYFGWPEVEGGFDIIMVTCAARYVPPALLEQLKPGGRLIIPVGPPIRGKQVLYVYTKTEDGKVQSRRDIGVYFIPMTGAMEKEKAPVNAAAKGS